MALRARAAAGFSHARLDSRLFFRGSIARSGFSCIATATASGYGYTVESWSETPYLELVLGLRPEGQSMTAGAGSTLAAVRAKRPNPGYYGRLMRMRLENASSMGGREAILDKKSYVRDFESFWIPMLGDLMGGDYHHYSLEVFTWLTNNPMVLLSAKRPQLEQLYATMISYAGVVGSLRLARIWFDDLKGKGLKQSTRCCNALILAYAKKGDVQTALSILEQMKAFRKGCSPNVVTYYILIAMFARLGDAPGLANLLGDSECSSFRPDPMTYNTLLCGYSKMGMPEDFDKTHGEMVEDLEDELSEESYNALLVGCSRLDRLDELQRCVGEMLAREMSLASPVVAEEIAKAYRRNRWVEGLDTVIQLEEKSPGISPTFQSFVNACNDDLEKKEALVSR
ncbi:pentatricopeptide repeat-containing protein At5g02860 [Selaginella moellendorffii]|uniref:pentatricopeptide repeat-containing protein At5g02860 n=1 Tax=Selaginella moellendorffii TaxID=88036 RepID=UPI000D1CDF7F|nr:pentatricopeptide repeat-containing protein At5g02860 [Selaginella moellendorffii]|eukprot:XP_024523640.1 pentatricopeptide repeat-containing protein At5g02860 [Selaginella moellendorffii]